MRNSPVSAQQKNSPTGKSATASAKVERKPKPAYESEGSEATALGFGNAMAGRVRAPNVDRRVIPLLVKSHLALDGLRIRVAPSKGRAGPSRSCHSYLIIDCRVTLHTQSSRLSALKPSHSLCSTSSQRASAGESAHGHPQSSRADRPFV